jgi:serine/threonine protein kinase/tetratricopeptide (TPR) repeat protein
MRFIPWVREPDENNPTHAYPVAEVDANPPPTQVLWQGARAYRELYQAQPPLGPADVEDWCTALRNNEGAQVFRDLHRSDPAAAEQLAVALTALPEVGSRYSGFELIQELGRGAFARVFLARQADLAGRQVVLKLSTYGYSESQTLAQLQHTNIVPVYSVHRLGPFRGVCMPYFGSTTLDEVIRSLATHDRLPTSGKALTALLRSGARTPSATVLMLERCTYVDAVLWLGSRLADGLAHAHERGILHRDLKPANILLTDDGEPMLLDFNLAEDTKLQASAAAASVGGTLLYMAPEQLEAFLGRTPGSDVRGDVYALGVVLFELLAGQYPFPRHKGELRDRVPRMVGDRRALVPDLRRWNPAVSPALEAIVRKCLHPDPAGRYQSARDLREDLDRQRRHEPLRFAGNPSVRERLGKWVRRHPRLTSATTVGTAAAVLLAVLSCGFGFWAYGRIQTEKAQNLLAEFRDDWRTAQRLLNTQASDLDRRRVGLDASFRGLGRYRVLDDAAWRKQPALRHLAPDEQERLGEDLGELLLLATRGKLADVTECPERPDREGELQAALELNTRAEACFAPEHVPPLLWAQRARLKRLLDQVDEADRLAARARSTPPRTARDHRLEAAEHLVEGHVREAIPLLREAARQDPQDFWAWLLLGHCYDRLNSHGDATACYTACVALWPEDGWAHFNRGLARARLGDRDGAHADFQDAVRLLPDEWEPYVNRGISLLDRKDHAGAIADFTKALDLGAPWTRVYFLRARAKELAGDRRGAEQDRAEGFRREPTDEQSWIARGVAREDRDPQRALADYRKALELNPRSFGALQNIARVLSDDPRLLEEAVAALTKALDIEPDYAPARSGRGVLLARLGRRKAALEDAEAALLQDRSPPITYQVAGIYALTSKQVLGDRARALQLLASALRQGYGLDDIDNDPELEPIRKEPEFVRLVEAARALRTGGGK